MRYSVIYMPVDQFGEDLDETFGYDFDILDEDDIELCRIRHEDIRYINGDRCD